jgi:ATP-binding cassette, subfamily B, multidrug efflux pump
MNKLLRKYLGMYKTQVLLVLIFVALQVVGTLALPTIMANIVDIGLPSGDMSYILKEGGLMLLMSLAQMGAMIGVGYFSSRVSAGIGRAMRRDVFVTAETFSASEMDKLGVSSMIVRNTSDVTMMQNFCVMLMRMVIVAPVMCIGSIVLALNINKELARVLLVAIPFLLLLFVLIILFATKLFDDLKKKNDRLNLLLREHISGVRVIRAFVNQKTEREKFEKGNQDLFKVSLKVLRITSSMMPGMMLIINMSTVAVCYFGAIQVEAGGLQVGQLMSFIQYVTQILSSLGMLSMLMVILPRANISAKRINEVLELKSVITEPETAKVPEDNTQKGTLEFKNVSFTYPGSSEPVLSGINFTAEGGKTTAIIGSTGCGKSTLLSLIPRLYDVTEGSILLDGLDVRDFAVSDLRSRIGYIPQKGYLFTGTIADNVRFGCPQATDEQVESALKTAQAWNFVSQKENGVNEEISQGGKNVSGGQKQRLAIARAIVRDCELYIFDDSFSALDFETDSRLRAALAKDPRLGKSTRIIVAQRVSTIMNADNIIVLDNGKIVGQGHHKELLKTCPLYYEIASSQLSEEELEK